VTDPESRIVKTRWGYVQECNAQAVMTGDLIILVANCGWTGAGSGQEHKGLRQLLEQRNAGGTDQAQHDHYQ